MVAERFLDRPVQGAPKLLAGIVNAKKLILFSSDNQLQSRKTRPFSTGSLQFFILIFFFKLSYLIQNYANPSELVFSLQKHASLIKAYLKVYN